MRTIVTTLTVLLVTASFAGCGQGSPATTSEVGERGGGSAHTDDHSEEGHSEGEHSDEEGESHADEESAVELTPEQLANAGLGLVRVGSAQLRETLPLYGVVTPNVVNVRQVTARFPGVIRGVSKSFGDEVRQGETLAVVESNESLQRYNVTAPITGVVTGRDANLGEQTGDRVLFTVVDLSTVWVELSLFPKDIGKVMTGQTVRIEGAGPSAGAEGRVIWVAPFGTSATQALSARVLLDNPDRRWAPGLYITAEVTLGESEVPLAVRNEALQTVDDRTVVFVESEHGFEPRPIRTGRTDGETTEVLSGLTAGETYVVTNSFILKAELAKGEAEHSH